MLRFTYRQYIVLAFIAIASILISFTEPAFSQRTQRKSEASNGPAEQSPETAQPAPRIADELARQQQEAQERIKQQQEAAERAKQQQQEAQERAKQQQDAERARLQQEATERVKQQKEAQERAKQQQEAERARQQQEAAERAKQQQKEAEAARAKQQQEAADRAKKQQQSDKTKPSNSNSSSNPVASKPATVSEPKSGSTANQPVSSNSSRQDNRTVRQSAAGSNNTNKVIEPIEQKQTITDSKSTTSSGQGSVNNTNKTETLVVQKQPVTNSQNQINSDINKITRSDIRKALPVSTGNQPSANQRNSVSVNTSESAELPGESAPAVSTNAGVPESRLNTSGTTRGSTRTVRKTPDAENSSNNTTTPPKEEPDRRAPIINKTDTIKNPAPARVPITHRYLPATPHDLIYRDRPYTRDSYHYEHVYVGYDSVLHYKTIMPGFNFIVCYNNGLLYTYRHIYPYYHRKFVFVDLWGCWPAGYRYARYYWYGYHPYNWYGYYPVAREVRSDTYNYYTYNYYYNNNAVTGGVSKAAEPDYKLVTSQAAEPADTTLADIYFEDGVTAFEDGDYKTAIVKFAGAMELAPDDIVLPFAYCQALLANEQYTEAANILRLNLQKDNTAKEGVFYPRGLYLDEDVLLEQLDQLAEKAELYSFDADLQLLLGYQLLGLGQRDKAVEHLTNACLDLENSQAATVLLNLLEKLELTENQSRIEQTSPPQPESEIPPVIENKIIENPSEEKIEIITRTDTKEVRIDNNKANFVPVTSSIIEQVQPGETNVTVLLGITLLVFAGLTSLVPYIKR
jgi:tetratricopeptide (TPR) repeat protein